jgi:hypothetical protein
MKIDDNRQTTADRCKSKKKMIMKARNLESAKKGLGFYITPSSFVFSPAPLNEFAVLFNWGTFELS